jgi:type I restriction enzyme, S subunit
MTKPGFKRTALGDIPLEWEVKKLEDVARELNERAENARDAPVLSVTKYDGFVPSLEYFKKQIFSRSTENYKLVRRNQFAYSTIHLDEGAISLLEDFEAGLISPMYTVFETDAKKVDPKFFSYQLRSDELMQMYGQIGQGSVNRRKSIGFSTFGSIEIRLPPLLEQQRIAAILSSVDDLLESSRRVLDQVRELRRGVMGNVLTRGVPGWHEHWSAFYGQKKPSSWHIKDLSECAEIQTGIQKGKKYADRMTLEVAYIRVANVQDGFFDLSEIKTISVLPEEVLRYRLEYGDVLLTEGGDADKLGRGNIWREEIPGCIHQNHIFCVRANREILNPEFFNFLTSSEYAKRYFLGSAKQSTNLASINSSQLKALPVLIPPLLEQEKIVSILSSFDQRIQTETQRITSLEHLKKGLMQHLLTGKLRVKLEVRS